MNISPKTQYVNYLAIELLERLGNSEPTQQQIDLMESLISRVAIDHKLSFDHRLTEREVSCLQLSAWGKTSQEAAHLLGIKTSTVRTHRKEILRKLKCSNITEAVFVGLRYGYFPAKCSH